MENDLQIYLKPGKYIDSDSPEIAEFARTAANGEDGGLANSPAKTPVEKAISLYYAVRDRLKYDPYKTDGSEREMKASFVLNSPYGNCISKSVLLAAAARAEGIPSRLGFADVKNHLVTERLKKMLRSEIFHYHGFTELFLEGKWVKATPAFDRRICERFNVKPLEFNGKDDSVFQEFDGGGKRFMEYLHDYGTYADLPFGQIMKAFEEYYPHLAAKGVLLKFDGDFEKEAMADKNA